MQHFFYCCLVCVADLFGPWFFALVSRGIAAGYFLLFPVRVRTSVRFYQALFPRCSRFYHLYCTFLQFQNFTSVFLDRFLMQTGRDIPYTFEGEDILREAQKNGKGGILLMSHIGNWEIAAHLLRRALPDLSMMLLMGQRPQDEIERLQKNDLNASGIRVLVVDRETGSPFSLVECLSFLRGGGFVSLSGDTCWQADQHTLPVRFLGQTARLPETPHRLALVSGAPLFIFFASQTRRGHYHFTVSPPLYVRADTREDRHPAICRSAQAYADQMEAHLKTAPFEWYHFEPFLEDGDLVEAASPG
ncbi:lysophospholipid acyltransferase family protein [Desulfosarcina sp. OttesenSCG-928-G10]|nr:lysophospholipid acyltransferase family protein [Desulfosarcina sp. OttesenSCG-928-G10]MDL2320901.1 lysophospholipid acyltransferase family protein [Desulfosarcina sp. OttesenSCG-928-B08]